MSRDLLMALATSFVIKNRDRLSFSWSMEASLSKTQKLVTRTSSHLRLNKRLRQY